MDADDVDAAGDRERGRRQGRLEALIGAHAEDPAERRFAARAKQDRPAEHAEPAELADELEVLLRGLAEPETRVDDQVVPRDAEPEGAVERALAGPR